MGKPLLLVAVALVAGAHLLAQAARPDPLVRENATQKVSDHVYVIPDNSVPLVPEIATSPQTVVPSDGRK